MDSNDSNINSNTRTYNYIKKPPRIKAEDIDYSVMSNDELIGEIKKLNSHIQQLKILLDKAQTLDPNEKINNFKQRKFDFNKYNKRHVLLKFAYLGWDYKGFITQEGVRDTVENHIFNALIKTKLIESRQTSNYHRCGRTDKGVSAFTQTISIDFRSNCASGIGVIPNPESGITNTDIKNETNYVKLLNGVLPDSLRVIAWSPVNESYSSRFDCDSRAYRYFFPKGDLNIDLMRIAGKKLIGEHDFRNFCKLDVGNGVLTHFRSIDNIDLNILDKESNAYSMVELIVEGKAFLWHQIRSIVSILFLVGQSKEDPAIIDELLDMEKFPAKPRYNISSELPLVLFDCSFKNVEWICDVPESEKVIKHFQDVWVNFHVKSTVVKRMIDYLEIDLFKKYESEEYKQEHKVDKKPNKLIDARKIDQTYSSLEGKSLSIDYIKLKDRETTVSFEKKVEHFVKRRKLDVNFVNSKLEEGNYLTEKLKNNKNNKESNFNINKNEESIIMTNAKDESDNT